MIITRQDLNKEILFFIYFVEAIHIIFAMKYISSSLHKKKQTIYFSRKVFFSEMNHVRKYIKYIHNKKTKKIKRSL